MILQKFKNIYHALKSDVPYSELLQNKKELIETRQELVHTKRNLAEVSAAYQDSKKNNILACFSPDEMIQIRNQKIEEAVVYHLEQFNQEFINEMKNGKTAFNFTIEDPQQKDIKALHIIASKLKQEGMQTEIGRVESHDTGGYGWTEINMLVRTQNSHTIGKILKFR